MRFVCLLLVLCVCALSTLSGQTALATITGVVTDQTGAVVANAPVEAKNVDTGIVTKAVSTETGNYTLSQLPVGRYQIDVTLQGFKKYSRQNISLLAAQVLREDINLQIGSTGESVTVTAESTLLKTESSDITRNVTIRQLENLPILPVNGGGTSSATSGFRDPFAMLLLIPGTQYTASTTMTVNGITNNSGNIVVEGQLASNLAGGAAFTHQTQPSVDAIQEVAIQTSNFAAEFGAVSGAQLNITMKSGTNQYHGVGYDYAAHDALGAAQPYSGLKTKQRRHDYGGTLGGPVRIPKVYDGTNKTFFFFNFEQYRENALVSNTSATVPSPQYRAGNFAQTICLTGSFTDINCAPGSFTPKYVAVSSNVGTPCASTLAPNTGCWVDPLGNVTPGGTIFDPFSTRTVTCSASVPSSTCFKNNQVGQQTQYRDAFPGNQIPNTAQYRDPIAARVLNLVPLPFGATANSLARLDGNYQNPWPSHRTSQIPSIKVDHSLGSKGHISYYYGNTVTESQYSSPNGNSVGWPSPIDPARGTFIYSPTHRMNYDHTLTPTLLLHVGLGYNGENFWDWPPVQDYQPGAPQSCSPGSKLNGMTQTCTGGLGWAFAPTGGLFPGFSAGVSTPNPPIGQTAGPPTGGMNTTGVAAGIHSSGFSEHRESSNVNLSWVRRNHTYKIGWDFLTTQIPTNNLSNTSGTWSFGASGIITASSTNQPALQGVTTSAGSPTTGFGFADFLMGNLSQVTLGVNADSSNRKKQTALFLQDTWKVTRRFTLDYGLRWDYGTYAKEQYGRSGNFDFNVPNPSAGNHPGGQIYEATCHCQFANIYPYAIGPRVGLAYQLNSKTVVRGGIGIVYRATAIVGGSINRTGNSTTLSFGQYLPTTLAQGLPSSISIKWPDVNNPAAGQPPGNIAGGPTLLDPGSGRPGRLWQYNFTVQREITRNFVVEASYVGHRGVWQPVGSGLGAGLVPGPNDMSVDQLTKYGFTIPHPGNSTSAVTSDSSILRALFTALNANQRSILVSRGVSLTGPYTGFPVSGLNPQQVRQSLRAFPQYTGINWSSSPVGKNWYDALQLTATKRLSHGLSVNANYTFSKNMDLTSSPDIYNPGLGKDLANDLPHQLRISADYTVPKIRGDGILGNKFVSYILSDWGTGWFLQYQSGAVIPGATNCNGHPSSSGSDPITNYLNRGTICADQARDASGNVISPWAVDWIDLDGKVHPEPIDINCKCFNPQTTQLLNPAAWVNVNNGEWSNNYSTIRDYRTFRVPSENVNFSRTFRIKERVSLLIRAEWTNAFNRLRYSTLTFATGSFNTALSCSGLQAGQTCTPNSGIKAGGFGSLVVPSAGASGQRSGNLIMRLQF